MSRYGALLALPLTLVLTAVLAGCATMTNPSQTSAPIEGSTWLLTGQLIDGTWTPVPDDLVVSLTLADGRAGGNGGCNSYFGSYDLQGQNLDIGRVGSTMMACAGTTGKTEQAYFDNLEDVVAWSSTDGTSLTLSGAEGTALLKYRAAPEASIRGNWVARGINDGQMAVVSSGLTSRITADFGADRKLTGFDGCNRYFTTYEVEGKAITISPQISTTRRACESDEVMQQSEQYYAALAAAETWSVDAAGGLELRDGDGALQVRFAPSEDEGHAEPISNAPWAEAARRGVTFRALGNEPAWVLEVTPEHLAMITNLGTQRTQLAYESGAADAPGTRYHAAGDGHQITVEVGHTPCVDSMSGEKFEATVTVTFDGVTYRGCGRSL